MSDSDIKIFYKLDEDSTPDGAIDVHYMSPEALEGREKIPTEVPQSDGREVFHDEKEEKKSQGGICTST